MSWFSKFFGNTESADVPNEQLEAYGAIYTNTSPENVKLCIRGGKWSLLKEVLLTTANPYEFIISILASFTSFPQHKSQFLRLVACYNNMVDKYIEEKREDDRKLCILEYVTLMNDPDIINYYLVGSKILHETKNNADKWCSHSDLLDFAVENMHSVLTKVLTRKQKIQTHSLIKLFTSAHAESEIIEFFDLIKLDTTELSASKIANLLEKAIKNNMHECAIFILNQNRKKIFDQEKFVLLISKASEFLRMILLDHVELTDLNYSTWGKSVLLANAIAATVSIPFLDEFTYRIKKYTFKSQSESYLTDWCTENMYNVAIENGASKEFIAALFEHGYQVVKNKLETDVSIEALTLAASSKNYPVFDYLISKSNIDTTTFNNLLFTGDLQAMQTLCQAYIPPSDINLLYIFGINKHRLLRPKTNISFDFKTDSGKERLEMIRFLLNKNFITFDKAPDIYKHHVLHDLTLYDKNIIWTLHNEFNVNVNVKGKYGDSLLSHAIYFQAPLKNIAMLIELGVDVNSPLVFTKKTIPPINYCCRSKRDANSYNSGVFQLLLDSNIDTMCVDSLQSNTILMELITVNEPISTLKTILKKTPIEKLSKLINHVNSLGETAMILAVKQKNLDYIKFLLETRVHETENSLIKLSNHYVCPAIFRLLLDDVEISYGKYKLVCFEMLCNMMKILKPDAPSQDLCTPNNTNSPCTICKIHNEDTLIQTTEMLLEKKIMLDASDENGCTLLMHAIEKKLFRYTLYLQRIPNIQDTYEVANKMGNTALHYACKMDMRLVVEDIIKKNKDAYKTLNKDLKAPIDLCSESMRISILLMK